MPLIKSASPEAVSTNISREQDAGKPHKQAVAIALETARRAKRAKGGGIGDIPTAPGPRHVGPIISSVPGRTDSHNIQVPSGSYILPSEHVASLGEGNTLAGMKILDQMFKGPRAKQPFKFKPSRKRKIGMANGGEIGQDVPIMAAGGEYSVPPEAVAELGGGDIEKGHRILDKWVMDRRKAHISTLKKLPKPAKD